MSGTTRHCPRCNTNVEDVGGFCLLGHRLNEGAHNGSLTELRAEVDRAFEAAKVQVEAVLQAAAPPPPPLAAAAPLRVDSGTVPPAPAIDAPPAPTMAAHVSAQLVIDTQPVAGDPIVDFAPAPRMDWGPERHGLLKRLG